MTEKPGDYQALRQTLDGIMGGSAPIHRQEKERSAAASPSITINAGTVIINTGHHASNHVAASPLDRTISNKQAACIKGLVAEIVRRERQRDPSFKAARVWADLNATMGVLNYKQISMADFDRAKDWLNAWLHQSKHLFDVPSHSG